MPRQVQAPASVHAALLIELGYSFSLIAERIGDTVKVVEETYAHLYPNKQILVAKELERHQNGLSVS